MNSDKAFPGRVIFDHLPKTAGQAINAWLTEALGTGCVTPNLIGNHVDLIKQYGGLYSIISAHVFFDVGEGLDPRYQYITTLRKPVDRVVSWLYFVLNNHDDSELPELRVSVSRFLESNGQDIPDTLMTHISNVYVEHFCRIKGSGRESDEEKIANALAAIKQYDVVGMFDEMPIFLRDVATLIGIPPPQEITRINVTRQRPRVDQIYPRERIVTLNQLDLRLFVEVLAWKASTIQHELTLPLTTSIWKQHNPKPVRDVTTPFDRVVTTPDAAILKAVLREGNSIRHGQLMTFDVDFFLAREVSDLEMGIHVFDGSRQWAFGINSTLLGQSHQSMPSGSYRVSHHLVADLPAGKYTAGFAFAERLPDNQLQELAWHDVMCEFQVYHQVSKVFAGYSYLPAEISLHSTLTPKNYHFPGNDSRLVTQVGIHDGDCIISTGQAGYLIFGAYIPLTAGQYQVLFRCTVGKSGLAGAYMDIVADKGNRVLTVCGFEEPDEDGCFIVGPISLNAACCDLEVRVWVTENSDLQISMIEIAPCQPDFWDGDFLRDMQAGMRTRIQEESVSCRESCSPKVDSPMLSIPNDLIGDNSEIKATDSEVVRTIAKVVHEYQAPASRSGKHKKSRNNKRR